MYKSVLICLLGFAIQSMSQDGYEVYRYFNSLTSCSDTNAYMEDFNCVYVKVEFPIFNNDNAGLNDIVKIFIFQNFFEKPYNNFDVYSKEFFEEYLKEQQLYKSPEWWYTIGIDTVIISNRINSISIGSYKYMGGAHGVSRIVTLNYDKETGRILDLDNIFITDYESKLNSIMNMLVKNKEVNTNYFDYNNYSYDNINTRFLIGTSGLIFKFDWYDEAYRNGAGEILFIPYKHLKNILNQEYYFLMN